MWVEIIVGGALVSFSNAGMYLNRMGVDTRLEWIPKIEAEARKICGRSEGVKFRIEAGDVRVNLHEDAVRPMLRAIDEALTRMPEDIHWFFQRISYMLEHGERYTLQDLIMLNQKEPQMPDRKGTSIAD